MELARSLDGLWLEEVVGHSAWGSGEEEGKKEVDAKMRCTAVDRRWLFILRCTLSGVGTAWLTRGGQGCDMRVGRLLVHTMYLHQLCKTIPAINTSPDPDALHLDLRSSAQLTRDGVAIL
jgi:hypothetical protein